MPLTLADFQVPKFLTPTEKLPFGEDPKDKYLKAADYPRNYRGDGNSFPQAGYNPHSNTAVIKKVNIDSEEYTLPPY